jgi:hypothetical protein
MLSRARTSREAFFGEPETREVAMTETLDFTALDQFLGRPLRGCAHPRGPADESTQQDHAPSPFPPPKCLVRWRRPKPIRRRVPDRQRGERQSHGQNGDGTQ